MNKLLVRRKDEKIGGKGVRKSVLMLGRLRGLSPG